MRRCFLSEKLASHWGVSSRSRDRIIRSSQSLTSLTLSPIDRSRQTFCTASSKLARVFPQRNRHICEHNAIRPFTTSQRRDSELAVPRPTTIEEENRVPRPEWNSAAEEAQYRENFLRALENKQPNQVIEAMADPRSVELVGSLPRTLFLNSFYLLSPAHFVEPYRRIYHMLHVWVVQMQGVKALETVFDDFVRKLLKIMQYRVAAGSPPQIDEFTHLLACAREMGNGPMAEELWSAMHANDIAPTLECYNYYMGAKVWDHCYIGRASYNLQIIPYSYRKRRLDNRSPAWRGYGTAEISLKRVVLDIFSEMSLSGLSGDEETYVNVLLAAARVGDRMAAENILKTVWNVDVAALMAENEDSMLPRPVPYETGSPLYPTESLLFAVAHAFGVMSDIKAAETTVHFIASSYKLPIPGKVWHELFERTFVLSKEYTRRQATVRRRGRVPRDVVFRMFRRMTTYPHDTPKTVPMHRYTTQSYKQDCNLAGCKAGMLQAYELLSETRRKRKAARDRVMQLLQPALDRMGPPADEKAPLQGPTQQQRQDEFLFQSPLLADAIYKYDILRLEVYQQTYLMQRIAYAVIGRNNWLDVPLKVWELQERPRLLEEWSDFLPDKKKHEYKTMGSGTAKFLGETTLNSRHMSKHGLVHVRRMPDHPELFHPSEDKTLDDRVLWDLLLDEYPRLDVSISPLNRLYNFQVEHSEELTRKRKLFATYVQYPDDHPLSGKNNPAGGLFGRIRALGLEVRPQRTMFWQDGNPWNC